MNHPETVKKEVTLESLNEAVSWLAVNLKDAIMRSERRLTDKIDELIDYQDLDIRLKKVEKKVFAK